jgi:formylglycine-generating enzyme required for sulfatase activity
MTGKLNRFIYRPVDMGNYWVTIPAGEFVMGDEDPTNKVYLNAFEMGRYEVTNRQYSQCVRAGNCSGKIIGGNLNLYPVVNISWYEAQTFCAWIGGRLPTEAEWEKAARGSLERKVYPWGDEAPTCLEKSSNGANFYGGKGCTKNDMPVGSYSPNNYGLYDMAGNVWEFTSRLEYSCPYWYSCIPSNVEGFSPKDNPSDVIVLRGGSSSSSSVSVTTHDSVDSPFAHYLGIGFRCARSLP